MELLHEPFAPWHLAGTALALAAGLAVAARWFKDRWQPLARKPRAALGAGALSLLSLASIGWSLWNPKWVRHGGEADFRIEVLLDVSDSMTRDSAAWTRCHVRTSDWLASLARAAADSDIDDGIEVGVTTFGSVAASGPSGPLPRAPQLVSGLAPTDHAPGAETDLQAGLERAGARVTGAGGRGCIVLVSDGHPTQGDAAEAARELGARGIPVWTLPAEGSPPALAVAAANLPPFVESGATTRLRGTLGNQLGRPARAALRVRTNPGLAPEQGPHGASIETAMELDIAADQWARFRPELRFDGFGIQCVDIELDEVGATRPPQRRRFHTQVVRPPRLLAIGDNRWMSALSETDFEVVQKHPEDLTADMNFADVDAIVLAGVGAHRFPEPVQDAMRSAVESGGAGLFLVNGPHPGREREAAVLTSYAETTLGRLLPVIPRRSSFQPPSRHVILMLDTSGSMGGWEREMKTIARHIVQQLRPSDKLDIIAFTVSARQPIQDMVMTDANKQKALAAIDTLAIAGGTSPAQALRMIEKRTFVEGGLIFVSDGGFSPGDINVSIRRRPDLRVTVFSCGNNSYRTLQKLADPIFVMRGFDPSKVEIPYFGKKEEGRYYEKETFTPLPMPDLPRDDRLPLPPLDTPGSAFSGLRDDAVLIGVRPRLAHPLLATRDVLAGRSGVWTSDLDQSWLDHPQGREAVAAWLRAVVGFDQRDRYEFAVREIDDRLELTASLLPLDGRIPAVERLDARVTLPGGRRLALPLDPDPDVRGRFVGRLEPPGGDTTLRAFLEISEEGPDALPGHQSIPWVLPPPLPPSPPSAREPWTHGNNPALLRQIAALSGGRHDPPATGDLIRNRRAILREHLLWPWLVLAAAAALLGAVALRRLQG